MFGPLGPTLQSHLHLTDFQLAFVIAIPVVLGSLMRIPMGILTGRYGGRLVFTGLMAYSVVPLVLLALFHDSFATVVVLGFLLGVTGSSFAVGVPFVNRWYSTERQGFALGHLRHGHGRHRARRAQRPEARQALESRRPVVDRGRADGGDGARVLAPRARCPCPRRRHRRSCRSPLR